jgi:phage tail tape-measure protein
MAGKGTGEVVNSNPQDDRGEHNLSTGVGAGGGAMAGAAVGAAGGPIGMAAGAAIGALAGGAAGHGAGAMVNPAQEDAYWRNSYANEPYYTTGYTYDDYAPAYNLGYSSRGRYNSDFDTAEPQLRNDWNNVRGNSRLSWDQARHASRAAWHRVERAIPGDADGDGR